MKSLILSILCLIQINYVFAQTESKIKPAKSKLEAITKYIALNQGPIAVGEGVMGFSAIVGNSWARGDLETDKTINSIEKAKHIKAHRKIGLFYGVMLLDGLRRFVTTEEYDYSSDMLRRDLKWIDGNRTVENEEQSAEIKLVDKKKSTEQ